MFFPLGTDRPLRRPPLVTPVLIGVNIAVYVLQLFLSRQDPAQYERFLSALWVSGSDFRPWTLLTSAFLHSDHSPWHIVGNMLFLWVFGPNIEDRFGRLGFLLFYLAGASASGGVHALFDANPAIGASGAIAACTGAYLVLFPRTQVKCFMLLGFIGVVRVSAWWFIVLAVSWDVMLQVTGANSGIAHAAHLGGTLFGASVAMVLLWLKVLPREPFDLFTMGQQALRRRQFKEAGLRAAEENARRWSRVQDGPAQEEAETLASARAEVTRLIGEGEMVGAAAAYRDLADRFADKPGASTLSRRHQHDLANYLYSEGRFVDAAYAYERLLEAYPKESDAPRIRLLLGLIFARQLNDPVRAKSLISEAATRLSGGELEMARQELASLG